LLTALTEVIATSTSVDASLPASLVHRHLKSSLGLVPSRRRAEVADLQLGKVLGEILVRHPTTDEKSMPVQNAGKSTMFVKLFDNYLKVRKKICFQARSTKEI